MNLVKQELNFGMNLTKQESDFNMNLILVKI